ncbi:Hypothetical predicted protein [Paramuricea clavata]|uniref:Uncharacterized protein n=1 Tax=Paramuricea clavata TaxID=317549 RepID=A0A7D9JCX0_PARCT|nr:Hypothetical predicted protein [Paramuricea clavata]
MPSPILSPVSGESSCTQAQPLMMSTPVADNIVPGKTSEPCESPPSKRRLLSDSTLRASDLARMYKRRFLLFGDNALNAQMNDLKPDLIFCEYDLARNDFRFSDRVEHQCEKLVGEKLVTCFTRNCESSLKKNST